MTSLVPLALAFALGVVAPADGTLDGPCYGNGTCNAGLACVDDKCIDATPEDGTDGGKCYGNGTCNAGLACATDGTCGAPAPPPPSPPPPSPSPPPLATPPATPPAPASDGRPRVLLLPLEPVDVKASDAALLDGSVAGALHATHGIELVTQADLTQLVALEAQRELLGCNKESCLAELAGAIGARYVVYGRLGQLGALWLVQLNLFDSQNAKAVGREEVRASSIESMPLRLEAAAARLVASLAGGAAPARGLADLAERLRTTREARKQGAAWAPVGSGLASCSGLVGTLGLVTTVVTLLDDADVVDLSGDSDDYGNTVLGNGIAFGVGGVGFLSGAALAGLGGPAQGLVNDEKALAGDLDTLDPQAAASYATAAAARDAGAFWTPVGVGLVAGGAVALVANTLGLLAFGDEFDDYATVGVSQLVVGGLAVAGGTAVIVSGTMSSGRADELYEQLDAQLAPEGRH